MLCVPLMSVKGERRTKTSVCKTMKGIRESLCSYFVLWRRKKIVHLRKRDVTMRCKKEREEKLRECGLQPGGRGFGQHRNKMDPRVRADIRQCGAAFPWHADGRSAGQETPCLT
jgi:hypothetical protein